MAGRLGRQGRSARATMSKEERKKICRGQKSMGAREAELALEVWGSEEKPRKNRRGGRAGEAAALKSKKVWRRKLENRKYNV